MADTSKGKQTKFEMVIGAVDRFSGVFKSFNDRMDKGTAQINRMKKSVQGLSKATGLSQLTASVGGVATGMRNVAKEGKALVSTLIGFAGKASLLFGGAGAGLLALAKGTANAGSAAADAASRAGVGIRTWQEYAHAANLSGVGNEQLEMSFRKLQDMSIKAFKGDKTQASLLKLAGIDPKTAKGEIKNADSIMLELADKVKALRDSGKGAQATNLVKNLFGDQGAKLMPMLQGGADGLKKMRMEAHNLGLVFSGEDAEASSAFNNSLAKLSASFKGIGFTVGKKILPPVTKLVDKFSDWASGKREIIGTKFDKWVDGINIDELWESIESGLNTLVNLGKNINDVVQRFGGWKTVAMAIAAFMGGKFVWSIASLVGSFGKLGFAVMSNPLLWKVGGLLGNATLAFGKFSVLLTGKVVSALASAAAGFIKFGVALMTTPVGWFIAACAAIGTVAYAIYKNWDGIVAYFQGLWKGVKDAFSRNWMDGVIKFLVDFNPVRLVLKGMNELIAYFTGINLMEQGAKIIDSLGDGISVAWKSLMDWFTGKLKWFSDKWDKVKGFFGYGDDEASGVSMDDSSGDYQGSGFAAPLNLSGTAKELNSRTEHVERQENTVTLVLPEGTGTQVSGPSSGVRKSGTSLQIGYEAYGY